MFSYLHGIRPSNRRSAITPATASHIASAGQNRHEGSPNPNRFDLDAPPSRQSQPTNLNEAYPISASPPLLPPIPRVASQHDSPLQESRDNGQLCTELRTSPASAVGSSEDAPKGSISSRYNGQEASAASMSLSENSYGRSQTIPPPLPTEQARPAPGRRKRPIDIRFEQMRAYAEPPFRQSIHTTQNIAHSGPKTGRPPPPPPKSPQASSAPLELSFGQARQQRKTQIPVKLPAEPRYQSRIEDISDDPQRQPSVQAQSRRPESSHQHPSTSHHRHGKAKLNLLNPRTLLARRRSHQAVVAAYVQSQNPPALQLPDDYDPRIRGNVVHDFSAPRPGRTLAAKNNDGQSQDSVPSKSTQCSTARDGESPPSAEREHAPIFREHFDDGLEKSQDPATRSSAFLHQMSVQASQPQPDPVQLPAFARKLPSIVSANIDGDRKSSFTLPSAALEVVLESPDKDQTPAQSTPPISPPKPASTATSISDVNAQGEGFPKRYESNSSRFSFDLAGVGSAAQEKLLEDKHRQKADRSNQRESMTSIEGLDDQYNGVEYDAIDDGGYEERIPGVNCDEDDEATEENNMPVLQRDMESFNFVSPNKSSFESTTSPTSTGVTSLDTPRDLITQQVGFTMSKSSPNLAQLQSGEQLQVSAEDEDLRPRSTPGRSSKFIPQPQPLQQEVASEVNIAGLTRLQSYMDDDLYFDDGMIDDVDDVSDQGFDEELFDSNTSGLYSLPSCDRTLQTLQKPELGSEGGHGSLNTKMPVPQNRSHESKGDISPSPQRSLSSDGATAELRDALTELNQQKQPAYSQTAGLTQDNLAAYNHDALSMAVNRAVLNGAFDRPVGLQSLQCPDEPNLTRQVAWEARRTGHEVPEAANFDTFDDEGLDDDPIVAAANAEALENDVEGFYGQEFGFFARACGSSEAEYANGGYFGPRALQGVRRAHSGKAIFQEPNLTPITERSEWSHRNSTASLAIHSHPLTNVSATSPQLADMPLDDMNMQLAMLKELRRGAWGGSDVSLQSSSNSYNSQNSGSPLAHLPPNGIFSSSLQGSNSNVNLQNMASSFHSFSSSNGHASSSESDPSPSSDSPTITLASAHTMPAQKAPMAVPSANQSTKIPPQPAMPPPPIPVHETPASPRNGRAKGHSINSSGAESVSYKEEGGKWVVERRRTSETGEPIFGRSVVEGGRI